MENKVYYSTNDSLLLIGTRAVAHALASQACGSCVSTMANP